MHHWESISVTLGQQPFPTLQSTPSLPFTGFASAEALMVNYLMKHPHPLPSISALLWSLKVGTPSLKEGHIHSDDGDCKT